MTLINATTNKPLISQKYFNDFDFTQGWTPGDIIWMEDYTAIDHKHRMAAVFSKIEGDNVFVKMLPNSVAVKASEQEAENVSEIIYS